ncbi:homeobox KN domain-containing protein [Limtongia smithiae]|uniref:homeobox KN domain-containing protein n=1 Tax=Limtongia smithiae TaxID=1125753 RepID=UPI0034CE18EC
MTTAVSPNQLPSLQEVLPEFLPRQADSMRSSESPVSFVAPGLPNPRLTYQQPYDYDAASAAPRPTVVTSGVPLLVYTDSADSHYKTTSPQDSMYGYSVAQTPTFQQQKSYSVSSASSASSVGSSSSASSVSSAASAISPVELQPRSALFYASAASVDYSQYQARYKEPYGTKVEAYSPPASSYYTTAAGYGAERYSADMGYIPVSAYHQPSAVGQMAVRGFDSGAVIPSDSLMSSQSRHIAGSMSSHSVATTSQIHKKRRGNLPKHVTDILRSWLNGHVHHPYPTEEEKGMLMRRTGLTMNQISNWFINARRRRLPALTKEVAAAANAASIAVMDR